MRAGRPRPQDPTAGKKTTKRKLAWGAIAVALFVAIAGIRWTFFSAHQISMTQAEIQSKIDAKIPLNTKNVTISNVQLDLSGDKIGLSMDATATKFHTEYHMSLTTLGTLRYDSLNGSFYFHPETLKIISVQANGESVSNKVANFIDKWVDSKKIIDNKTDIMAKAEALTQNMVQKSAEAVLTRVPVYTLKNDIRGNVIHVLLKDVEVKDGKIIAHLSLWQFTKMVAFYCLVLVLAVSATVSLFLFPEWGVALIAIASLGS